MIKTNILIVLHINFQTFQTTIINIVAAIGGTI